MNRAIGRLFATVILVAFGARLFAADEPKIEPAKKAADRFAADVQPLLVKYCHECHGPKKQEGGIGLHKYASAKAVIEGRPAWEKVLEMARFEAMPPEDRPQPSESERKKLIAWIEKTLGEVDCDLRDPGRVTLRRLNRVEYNNTVRDLLAVPFRPADDFPTDDVGYGFDNIGDVLSLPPLLLEKYLSAAERIAEAAIVIPDDSKAPKQRPRRSQLKRDKGVELQDDLFAFGTNAALTGEFEFARDGEYLLVAHAGAGQAGEGLTKMEFRLDGKPVQVFEVTAPRDALEPHTHRLQVAQGKRLFAAAMINDFTEEEKVKNGTLRNRDLFVGRLEVVGPVDLQPSQLPASHHQLLKTRPQPGITILDAARENLRPLADRAFRRPATDEELSRLAGLAVLATNEGESFERGMQLALTGMLVSPNFLFRVELDSRPHDSKATHALTDYELAARLSYFLWSSMPDDVLLNLASRGELRKDEVLADQVRRMLQDAKAAALAENFGGQWLNLRMLDEVSPDPAQFESFTPQLKADMRRETEAFFHAIVQEDRSILDFLEGKFTFVNERLARHYGLPGVAGDAFQRVDLQQHRAGVLTQASILTLTSNPTRTSPVKRGKWILENILGTPPPEPPPDVPELEAAQKAAPNASLRQQLELHRKDPGCATCHKQMDALGFGLENFDAIGRWRTKDGKLPIDSSGVLPGGEKFNGPDSLAAVLKKRKPQFSRALSEKMLTYALGRGLQYYDRCAVDKIVESLAGDDRFSALVIEIVKSDPFRMRRGEGDLP